MPPVTSIEINKHKLFVTTIKSLNYSSRNPKHNLINLPHQTVEKLQKKKTMGSSEDSSLVNNVDELGLVYEGLTPVMEQENPVGTCGFLQLTHLGNETDTSFSWS